MLTEKTNCIPVSGIEVTDYSAKVDLNDLLDHTAARIFKICDNNKISTIPPYSSLLLRCKTGMDGSTGQSVYKQKASEDFTGEEIITEESLFQTCLVPLQLVIEETGEEIWINDKPSSTLFCRPIRFSYMKETRDVTIEENRFLTETELHPTLVDTHSVKNSLELTMIDGKVATTLSRWTNSTLTFTYIYIYEI